jgi:hypothetical protein
MVVISLLKGSHPTVVATALLGEWRRGSPFELETPVDVKNYINENYEHIGWGKGYSQRMIFRSVKTGQKIHEVFSQEIGAFILKRMGRTPLY